MAAGVYVMLSLDGYNGQSLDDVLNKATGGDHDVVQRLAGVVRSVSGGNRNGKLTLGVGTAEFVAAAGTLTFTDQPGNNDTMVLGSYTITAKTSGASGKEFNIGGDLEATCTAIAALINSDSDLSALWTATSTATTVVVTANMPGAWANHVVFTTALTNSSADGSGTIGGTTAGTGGLDASFRSITMGAA